MATLQDRRYGITSASMKYDFVRLLKGLCKLSIPVNLGDITGIASICTLRAAFVGPVAWMSTAACELSV